MWCRREPARATDGPGRVLSRPCGGLGLECGGVALHRDDAQEVAPRRSEHVALQPLRDPHGAEGEQADGFGLDVVGLDVEVKAGCVIDCLDGGE